MRIFGSKRSKTLVLGLTAVLTMAVAGGTVLAGWGPDRPTFTWSKPANYITFNSITDNPVVGDERPFLSGKLMSASGNVVDKINVNDNDVVIFRVYFHNNAGSDLNLTATNTRVKIFLPKIADSKQWATSFITADNSNPGAVTDTVDLDGPRPFLLEYIPGSAIMTNNVFTNGTPLSDNIVTNTGALVGYNAVDGRVPGCGQFSGFVTIKVKVKMQPEQVKPAFSCDALNLTVHPNRKVDANVAFTATGGATLKDVTFDWGDGSTPQVTTGTSASHTYNRDGTFTVKATTTFNVDGTQKSTTSDVCTKQVTFSTPPTPPTPTPTPTPPVGKLPDTGAGSIVGMFAGVSTLAGAIHYMWGRRFGA